MTWIFIVFTGVTILFAGFVFWASQGHQRPGLFKGLVHQTSNESSKSNKLRVMTWNIAFGYGNGSEGPGYSSQSKQYYQNSLQKIADLIRSENIDIALFQEVDFKSDRSLNTNQLEELSKLTGLHYWAPAVTWIARYVPFPYYPIKNQFGKMNSGGGVISRYPISENWVNLFKSSDERPWWYNRFYPLRYFQRVLVDINGKQKWIYNLHLEAFLKEDRAKEAKTTIEDIEKQSDHEVLLIAGDFNSLPLNATKKNGFDDENEFKNSGYENDSTQVLFNQLKGFSEIISDKEYIENESQYFTFPAHSPERRLDYIFLNDHYRTREKKMVQTGNLSDHLPVIIEIQN